MSRFFPPSYNGILDIRSAGLLNDRVHLVNKCAPGAARAFEKGPFFRQQHDSKPRDQARDWLTAFISIAIIVVVYGIINSYIAFIPKFQELYGFSYAGAVMFGAFSEALFLLFVSLACFLEEYVGNSLTAVFGLCLFFLALLLETLELGSEVFWLVRLLLIPIGGACAYTAAMNGVADLFNTRLTIALVLLSISPAIGTFLLFFCCSFLLRDNEIGIKWTYLCLSILFLPLIAAAYSLPQNTTIELRPAEDKIRNQRIKQCLEKAAKEKAKREARSSLDPNILLEEQLRSCLCVCSFKMATNTRFDWSLLLWALISAIAVMTLNIPYLYIIDPMRQLTASQTNKLILYLCIGGIIGRTSVLICDDHTFMYNRTEFQITAICSAVLFFIFIWVQSYGWVALWAGLMGFVEGKFVALIPRVTLMTVSRKLLKSSWITIVILHSAGVLLGPWILEAIRELMIEIHDESEGKNFSSAAFAVLLILAAILTFLIPNEEASDEDIPGRSHPTNSVQNRTETRQSHGNLKEYTKITTVKYKTSLVRPPSPVYPIIHKNFAKNYSQDCPICSAIGCIPGCEPCTPGGLVSPSSTNKKSSSHPPDY